MQSDDHERARLLIDRDLVEGLSEEDRRWLSGHKAECAECAAHAEVTARILAGLASLNFATQATAWRRVALIAAGLVMLAVVPVYQSLRESAREQQDALLLKNVGARISQAVPEALEPLRSPAGGTK